MQALRKEAQATRDFVARSAPRRNRKGQELKANVTDNDSAKMATSKGVIQGYAAQAAADSAHQVIVAAEVAGSGSEQSMLLAMIANKPTRCDAAPPEVAQCNLHPSRRTTLRRFVLPPGPTDPRTLLPFTFLLSSLSLRAVLPEPR